MTRRKLLLKHNTLIVSIFITPDRRRSRVSGKGRLAVVEGDDVGVGVVIEVLAVVLRSSLSEQATTLRSPKDP